MLILSSADKLKDMEDKCNSGESHGAKTKEPDFLLTSNTYKSIKEDEYLESRASFVGPSLSVTIRVSKPPKIIGFICHSIILLETPSDLRRDTTRLATAKGASIACVDASHKRKNGHFGQSRTNGPDFLSPNTLLCIKERPSLSVTIGVLKLAKIIRVAGDKLAFSKVTNTINHLYGNGVMYIRN
ncbi:U4/U6 small nuclear ribonucleoprotein Prp31-like [Vespula maculifrons]|uniref:U4/U6 small nuclear ribonucleoprotein Prp31-like n=1 Tax=Vespula maculifrons TaxID=7453 RepID=A0ABD2AHJ1_VESMC